MLYPLFYVRNFKIGILETDNHMSFYMIRGDDRNKFKLNRSRLNKSAWKQALESANDQFRCLNTGRTYFST